ncbi:tetratricopeptide repeat protein [Rubinisphaera margarita]|uniref:tetratricopeptide repeat protein n=1 Tax=Rubinisphaera margarita TaxID=2909586 RepID=UPI001EE90467|nr:hypothetical protein [Rubinisphaera margarita]MCG6156940.1 hypothetical protein [Rubinisphaera margarita]
MLRTQLFVLATLLTALSFSGVPAQADEDADLAARVRQLEERLESLEKKLEPMLKEQNREDLVVRQRTAARERMRQDVETYTREDLQSIERLYQVANDNWQSPEAVESLKTLVEKYKKANRTGCAILYLGQMTKGDQQIRYLKQAIDDFSDCYYGNGVQVGAYGRFLLAYHLKQAGQDAEAERLLTELEEKYPDAIDHRGRLLNELSLE